MKSKKKGQRSKKSPAKLKIKNPKNTSPVRGNKVEYDGILFASGLEVYCYKQLKLHDLIPAFQYEKQSHVVVESFSYTKDCWEKTNTSKNFEQKRQKIQSISYTPDFESAKSIIETKGRQTDVFSMRWKLFKKHLVDTGQEKDLFMPSNQKEVDLCIKIILENELY